MLETKPTEMKDIGVTYNNLCKLLVEIEETINPPKVEEITKENNAQLLKAPALRLGEIAGRIAGSAQTDLISLVGLYQTLFIGTAKHCAVVFFFTKHVVIDIRMGVHMDHSHWAILFGYGAQNRQSDRVIPAHGNRHHIGTDNRVITGLDYTQAVRQREGVDSKITNVRNLKIIKRRSLSGHIIGPEHCALGPNLFGAEPGARTPRGADIQRNSQNGHI